MIVWFTGFICTSHDTLAWVITARFSAKVHRQNQGEKGQNAKMMTRQNKYCLENTSLQSKKINMSRSPIIQGNNAEGIAKAAE